MTVSALGTNPGTRTHKHSGKRMLGARIKGTVSGRQVPYTTSVSLVLRGV